MQNFKKIKNLNPKFNDEGLITAVIQNQTTKKVLMVGYMNNESLKLSLKGPDVWFFSRSKSYGIKVKLLETI